MRFKHFILALIVMVFVAIECQAATLKSDLVTNADASPVVMANPNLVGGPVRRIRATYTFTGSEATGDIVEMAKVPKGTIILRELSTVTHEAMASAITVEVGDVDDPNRYCSALGMQSVTVPGNPIYLTEAIGTDTVYVHNVVGTATTNDTVNLTLTLVTTPTAAKKVTLDLYYVSGG